MALWILGWQIGCLDGASQRCGNGAVCPPGLLCVDPGAAVTDGRICVAGTCGNGRIDPGEACDDGNNLSGDGCPADCTPPCGDGVRDPDEVCDDGNTVDGDGCAADCRSLDQIFLVSPTTVSFAAREGDPDPPSATVSVRLPSGGDTLAVETPPGVAPPDWLSTIARSAVENVTELELRATGTSVAGARATSVRLRVDHHDATDVETFDLLVSFDVSPSDLAVQVTPAALAFTAVAGDPVALSQTASVVFNGADVTVLAAPPWVTVAPVMPAASSPADFTVAISGAPRSAGTMLSDEIVFATTRGTLQRQTHVPVTYQVLASPALEIAAVPDQLTFRAIAGGALPLPQEIAMTFTGANVEVVSGPPWVTVMPPADRTTSPASFEISVNTTAFAAGTVQSDVLVIRTTRGDLEQAITIHLDYHVLYVPEIQFVAPYVGLAGHSGSLRVRGRGFPSVGPATLRIGALTLAPVLPDSDTQVTLSYPALPEGRYPVTMIDPPGIAPTAPELVIESRPAFTYQAIEAPTPRWHIVYDAERQAIYGVNTVDQQIEVFAYNAGTWSAQLPHSISLLTDLAMAPDGRSLVVVDQTGISDVSLVDGLFVPVRRAAFPTGSCSLFANAAAANNGKVLVLSEITGSGSCPSYLYDLLDHSLSVQQAFYFGTTTASAEGNRIFAVSGDFEEPMWIYDARTGTTSLTPVESAYALSASGDGSRLIVNDRDVYDGSLRLLGGIAYRGPFAALASRDSTRAFVYSEDSSGGRLDVYDLHGPLQSGALYPVVKTVLVPDRVNNAQAYEMAMTSSLDDSVVFISGADRILVVPVD